MITRPTLLIADSEAWAVDAIGSAADASGLKVMVASNGVDALERFRESLPQIVLCDRMLGVLDGIQLARKIRQSPTGRATPLIMTSSFTADLDELGESLRLTDVLPKPFTADDVSRLIEPLLPPIDEPAWDVATLPTASKDLVSEPLACELLLRRRAEATGRLMVWHEGVVKELDLDKGDVVGVASNSIQDGWVHWLARDPGLDAKRRRAALRLASETPYASLEELADMGLVKTDEMELVRERRMVALALDILAWKTGRFAFVEESINPGPVRVDGFQLALGGLRRRPAGASLETFLPAREARLGRNPAAPVLDLTAIESQVAALADGERTVIELLALGRLVQIDARVAIATLVAATALEPLEPVSSSASLPSVSLPNELRGDPLPASGSVEEFAAPRLLALLWAGRSTGILQVRYASQSYALHLVKGNVVFARSNAPEHRLGGILLELATITKEEHARAVAAQGGDPKRRIGAILVAHGALTLKELHAGLVTQVKRIVYAVMQSTRGSFTFVSEAPTTDDFIPIGPMPQLIVDACRGLELKPEHLRHLPGDRDLLMRVWDDAEISRLIALNTTERTLLAQLGTGTTMVDLFRLPELDKEDVLRCLYGFSALGVIHPVDGVPSRTIIGGEVSFEDVVEAVAQQEAAVSAAAADYESRYNALAEAYASLETDNRRLREAIAEREAATV